MILCWIYLFDCFISLGPRLGRYNMFDHTITGKPVNPRTWSVRVRHSGGVSWESLVSTRGPCLVRGRTKISSRNDTKTRVIGLATLNRVAAWQCGKCVIRAICFLDFLFRANGSKKGCVMDFVSEIGTNGERQSSMIGNDLTTFEGWMCGLLDFFHFWHCILLEIVDLYCLIIDALWGWFNV